MVIPTILGQLRSVLNINSNMAQQSSKLRASITRLSPEPEIKEPVDNSPSDSQPPGVDEDMNLEEALTSL